MNTDNIKNAYPQMPENIRSMIKSEVEKQLSAENRTYIRRRVFARRPLKITTAALIAVMLLGTAAFAGSRIYDWHTESNGKYGLNAGLVSDSGQIESIKLPDEIPVLSVTADYVPEGMICDDGEGLKYYLKSSPHEGGISMELIAMDENVSAKNLPLSDIYVTAYEELKINDREALYIENQTADDGSIHFNKKIYIPYPEYHQILSMYIGENVSKNEAIKTAAGLNVKTGDSMKPLSEFSKWSGRTAKDTVYEGMKFTASDEEMKNLHKTGEEFSLPAYAGLSGSEATATDSLTAKVSKVVLSDSSNILDSSCISEDLKAIFKDDGTLEKNRLSYIENGNGTDSLDSVVRKENVDQALAYVTVKFTNTGNHTLENVLYAASFMGLEKSEAGYVIYNRALTDNDENSSFIEASSLGGFGDMDYYDTFGGNNDGSNYIPSIEPGETVTVHIAKVVNKDETDKMYLNLSTSGDSAEFTKEALGIGYVDIRQ